MAARFAANLISLTATQQVAADASNNGSLSVFDASLIARTAANISNNGFAGTWKFLQPSVSYTNLCAEQTNQDFTGILIGDVSGNWTPPSSPSMIMPASARPSALFEVRRSSLKLSKNGKSSCRPSQRYVRATDRNKREAVQAAMLNAGGHNLATRVNQALGTKP